MGVTTYQLSNSLPNNLKEFLPSTEEIEKNLKDNRRLKIAISPVPLPYLWVIILKRLTKYLVANDTMFC